MMILKRKSHERRPTEAADGDVLLIVDTGSVMIRSGARWEIVIPAVFNPIHAELDPDKWMIIPWPGVHSIIPHYTISCRSVLDVNREIFYELRNESTKGIEIKVPEKCRLTVQVFAIQSKTILKEAIA